MIDVTQPEVAFAVQMVRQAAQLAQRVQSGMALQNLTKSDFSPVTVADYAVQALLGHAMETQFPEAVLVGEENSSALYTEAGTQMREVVTQFVGRMVEGATEEQVCQWIDRGTAAPTERFWVLDPVDGTKGYLRGGQYAVALALVENGEVILGALGCPNLGENCAPELLGLGALLIAKRGEGAFCTTLSVEEPFRPIQVSDCDNIQQARILRSVESGHTNANQIDQIAQTLQIEAEPILMDSQAKYATLAGGNGELLFRLLSPAQPDYREKIWDQAAGALILEEAGGKITDLHGAPLDFSQGRLLANNTGVFASNGILHDAGLDAIAKVCFAE